MTHAVQPIHKHTPNLTTTDINMQSAQNIMAKTYVFTPVCNVTKLTNSLDAQMCIEQSAARPLRETEMTVLYRENVKIFLLAPL